AGDVRADLADEGRAARVRGLDAPAGVARPALPHALRGRAREVPRPPPRAARAGPESADDAPARSGRRDSAPEDMPTFVEGVGGRGPGPRAPSRRHDITAAHYDYVERLV